MLVCLIAQDSIPLLKYRPGDGRHFAYQKESKFYNGVTMDDSHGEKASSINGIHGKFALLIATVMVRLP